VNEETMQLFEDSGDRAARVTAAQTWPRAREEFLVGMFAAWAAVDRAGSGAKPTAEEKRRGREAARAALGEILR
jgi:hypothetical protein